MEHIKQLEKELSKIAEIFPDYVKFCERHNAPSGLILAASVSVLLIIGTIL